MPLQKHSGKTTEGQGGQEAQQTTRKCAQKWGNNGTGPGIKHQPISIGTATGNTPRTGKGRHRKKNGKKRSKLNK